MLTLDGAAMADGRAAESRRPWSLPALPWGRWLLRGSQVVALLVLSVGTGWYVARAVGTPEPSRAARVAALKGGCVGAATCRVCRGCVACAWCKAHPEAPCGKRAPKPKP